MTNRALTTWLAATALLLAGSGHASGHTSDLAVGHSSSAGRQADGVIHGAGQPGAVEGSYIVVLRDSGFSADQTEAAAADLTTRYGGEVKLTYTATLRGYSVAMTEAQARELAADPLVGRVEQDGVAQATVADATGTQADPTWGLDRVDQKELPLDAKYNYGNTASDVTAYVIDTGVHKGHPDFGGRAVDGHDFIDNDSVAQDCHGHGTHVAGTIGSTTHGVAKGVKLVGIRVLNCQGSGQWSQIIGGLDWLAKNAVKPAVANMSLGGSASSSVDDAVRKVVAAGVTVVVASGNDNRDACGTSPARTPEAITANATDNSDNRSSFSNYGKCTDIFAPGTNITSTWNNDGTKTISGTSMAAPHVAGAAALYLSGKTSARTSAAAPADVVKALTDNATGDVVKNAGSSSPNKLLFTGFIGGDKPEQPACAGGSNTQDVPIPDAGEPVSSDIAVSGCDGRGTAASKVKVDIAHPYTADLAVDLLGPSGTAFPLRKAGDPGSPDGIHETFTVDTSAEDRNGTWKLRVKDVYTYDTGTIEGWSLTF